MVGPWGLEPQTSTVSKGVIAYFQPLEKRGIALVRESADKLEFLKVKLQAERSRGIE